MLAQTLRALERDGLLTRTEFEENPPRVEYESTPLGHSLFGPMDAACAWAGEDLDQLDAARARATGADQRPESAAARCDGEGLAQATSSRASR
ncbi:helix-turn-helix domain-containing protein [Kitasatospora sp. GAS204B]|uniref:winged helix-turn-helix transcriptional regulator n=1 Tax=unclassified Kitasatospora TaxID=2633591 RepID=UPI002476F608|nr:helix-turn-helix domain-containing protein [Kitasatospora sp. GAS204B]MDH6121516.1 DNA-binding HxlR family transcriptional regulator [Kitasatospora sp. GAS204B]